MRILIFILLSTISVSAQPLLISGGKLTASGTAINQFVGWDGSTWTPKTVPSFWVDDSGNPADATTDETDIIKRNGDVFCKKLVVHDFGGEYPSPSGSTLLPLFPNTAGINFSVASGTAAEFMGMSTWPVSSGLKGLVIGGNTTTLSQANGGTQLVFVAEKNAGTFIAPSVGDVPMRIGFLTSTGSGVANTSYGYSQSEAGIPFRVQCDRVITGTDNGYATILSYNGVGSDPATNIANVGNKDALVLASDGYIKFPQYSRTAVQDTQVVTQFFGLARYATDNKMVRKNISGIPNFGNTDLTVGANRQHQIATTVTFNRSAVESVPVLNIQAVENASDAAYLLSLNDYTGGGGLSFYNNGALTEFVMESAQHLKIHANSNLTLSSFGNINIGDSGTRSVNSGAQNYETTSINPVTATIDTGTPVWVIGNGTTTVDFPSIVASPSTGEAKIGDEITLIINGNTSAVTINPGSGDDFYITNGSGTSASDSNAANNNYFKIFKAISLTSWAVK